MQQERQQQLDKPGQEQVQRQQEVGQRWQGQQVSSPRQGQRGQGGRLSEHARDRGQLQEGCEGLELHRGERGSEVEMQLRTGMKTVQQGQLPGQQQGPQQVTPKPRPGQQCQPASQTYEREGQGEGSQQPDTPGWDMLRRAVQLAWAAAGGSGRRRAAPLAGSALKAPATAATPQVAAVTAVPSVANCDYGSSTPVVAASAAPAKAHTLPLAAAPAVQVPAAAGSGNGGGTAAPARALSPQLAAVNVAAVRDTSGSGGGGSTAAAAAAAAAASSYCSAAASAAAASAGIMDAVKRALTFT